MADLTIIFLTLNKMPEKWSRLQLKHLLFSAGAYPIISISRQPMDVGTNLIQTEEPSEWNIYRQILRGSKIAKTPYIAIAEDDVLYTPNHFREFRPPLSAVSYDMSRWSLYTSKPMYHQKRRRGNFAMIGPRKLIIEALSEREAKYPKGNKFTGEIGRTYVEKRLKVTNRKAVDFYASSPIVVLTHPLGLSPVKVKRRRRTIGEMKAYDIPYWGKASLLIKMFNDG